MSSRSQHRKLRRRTSGSTHQRDDEESSANREDEARSTDAHANESHRQQASGRLPRVTIGRSLDVDASRGLPTVLLKSPVWHPTVFRKRVRTVDPTTHAGDLVAVYFETDKATAPGRGRGAGRGIPTHGAQQLLGYGLYNPRSEIAVRMVKFGDALPDLAFWQARLAEAVRLRSGLLQLDRQTDAYRLIHAESDGLPGLIVDRFGDVLSAEAFSLGMFQRSEAILRELSELCGTSHFVIRTSPHVLPQEGFESPIVTSPDAPSTVTIQEHGTRFRVRLDEDSHKTGFFCDQRDNRFQLASYCQGRSVLDLCCYSGGFAIQAAKLGAAADVTGVDLDEHPLATARENANLNQVRVRFVQADVFPYMRDMLRSGRQYDVVILDPPKLIRNRAELEEGTRKHFDLNRLAMQLVRPGGLLLSCTCAGLLSQDEFMKLIHSAARQSGPPIDPADPYGRRKPRHLRVLARTGAAADHPVGGNCPETEYLNAVWMTLDDAH